MKSTFVKIAAIVMLVLIGVVGILVSRRLRSASANAQKGHEIYTNALIHSSSPYLLEHAHNPVNWYPWGAEALARARAQKKPIFLSIGYSACHWCHVMRREDFENLEIAKVLNDHFVCIKVDREQRPDIDAQYLAAVEMITGSGGWPLSVFLMPDLKPFYGGTYFPPDEFKRLLLKIVDLYQKQPEALQQQADRVAAEIAGDSTPAGGGEISSDTIQQAVDHLTARYDPVNGGFGTAPKFPEAPNLRFLLDRYSATHNPVLLKMVTHTLDNMAAGGIYDQLAGGFHRYSVDDHWRVPHFEKMLYDQALLIPIYLDAYQMSHRPLYRRVAIRTLDFVETAFHLPGGGFASSFDADSDGVEGKYYLWTLEQVKAVLGPAAPVFDARFGVSSEGDLEGKSVLHQNPVLAAAPSDEDTSAAGQPQRIESLRHQMLAARERRVAPGRDDKALAGWNGLAIAAFARGYQVLGDRRYLTDALETARFIDAKLMVNGRLMRSFYAGSASTPALLNDEAFVIRGYLALYDATQDRQWLDHATMLAGDMIHRFEDPVRGGFYSTAEQGELLARRKEAEDDALPSGNGVAAEDLARLAALTAHPDWREIAVRTAQAFQPLISHAPEAFSTLLNAYTLAGGRSLTPAAILTLTAKLDRADKSDRAAKPGETLTILFEGNVADGYHINAHEPTDKTVIPTTVELTKTPIAQLVQISYPAAERLELAGGGGPAQVYRGHFSIQAVVRIAKDAPPGPAELSFVLTYQPCSDRECLAPAKVTADISIGVAPT